MKAHAEAHASPTLQRSPFFRRGDQLFSSQAQRQPFFPAASIQRMKDETMGVQAKSSIGPVDNAFEKEADSVADTVMRMPDPQGQPQPAEDEEAQRQLAEGEAQRQPVEKDEGQRQLEEEAAQRQPEEQATESEPGEEEAPVQTKQLVDTITPLTSPGVQRLCPACESELGRKLMSEEEASRQIEEGEQEEPVQAQSNAEQPQGGAGMDAHLARSKGGGRALPDGVRSFLEPRFSYGFEDVRVHTDTTAANSAKSIGAAAYTSGQDIYFGAGKYQPDTAEGKHLVAHELTHVIQQAKGARGIRRKPIRRGKQIASSISPYSRPSAQLAPNVTAVTLSRSEIPAGRGRTSRARATVGRGIAVDWSIQGNARGATIAGRGRSATITAPAGSTGGVVTIRAADRANPAVDFEEAQLTLVQVQFQAPAFTFAPAMPGFAPANTMDASVCNNTATGQGAVIPAGRPLQWSIRGNRRGATIDPGTGVINPSATQTGTITVRVNDAALRRAFAEELLTIRPHPTGIRRTTAGASLMPGRYGAVYTHTFRSSGGAFTAAAGNRVWVTERVDCGNDPFGFCPRLPTPIVNGTFNAPISAGSAISDRIGTVVANPGIDVNRFLPSPPNPGLPQELSTPQIISWRSDQCSAAPAAGSAAAGDHWVPFVNVPLTVRMAQRGPNFFMETRDNRVLASPPGDAYAGPALAGGAPAASVCPGGTSVTRVRFTPSRLPADNNATTTSAATARVRPAGTALQWSFPGFDLGATLANPTPGAGNPAEIRAGPIAGSVWVRAAVVGTPGCFAEGRLRFQEVVIGRIRFSRNAIPPGAGNTARVTVSTSPGRRAVNWTIEGPNLGAVITRNPDNSANIVRGANRGRITVRATDQRDATKLNEASLVLR